MQAFFRLNISYKHLPKEVKLVEFFSRYKMLSVLTNRFLIVQRFSGIETQVTCDKGSFAFGIYVSFKKILIQKLNFYRVSGTESNWFKSYLGARQQHTGVNSFPSKNAFIEYVVPQCFDL